MAALTHKTDYLSESLSRLLEQFKGKPRFEAIITSYMQELQAAEDSFWDLYVGRLLQEVLTNGSANDDLIDKIGKLVGQPRQDFDNTIYIRLISARIRTNHSDGRRETLIAILQLLVPDVLIEAREYTGSIVLTAHGPVLVPPQTIAFEFLSRAVLAGVRGTFVWEGAEESETLLFGYKFNSSAILQPTTDQSPGYYGGGPSSGFYVRGGLAAGAFTSDGGST